MRLFYSVTYQSVKQLPIGKANTCQVSESQLRRHSCESDEIPVVQSILLERSEAVRAKDIGGYTSRPQTPSLQV